MAAPFHGIDGLPLEPGTPAAPRGEEIFHGRRPSRQEPLR